MRVHEVDDLPFLSQGGESVTLSKATGGITFDRPRTLVPQLLCLITWQRCLKMLNCRVRLLQGSTEHWEGPKHNSS